MRTGRQLSRSLSITAVLVLTSFTVGVPTQTPTIGTYGVMNVLDLGGPVADAYDIGEYGQAIVGRAQIASGVYHAFAQTAYWGQKDLGTLGGASSAAYAFIGGEVVGEAQTASGQTHAFLADMNANTTTDLGTLGGTWSAAYDLRYGVVVGASRTTGDARVQAFKYQNGTMSAVPVDRGGDTVARGVNNTLDIVGYACTAANASCRAFLFSGGTTSDMGLPAGNSTATSINDLQQVVGSVTVSSSGARHAYLFSNGTVTDLGTLGGATSDALAINEHGDVVGTSLSAGGTPRAVLWRNGTLIDLNSALAANSGWVLESATSISDGGQIVGIGTLNGVRRGFLLTPPTDLAVFPFGARSQEDSNFPRGIEVGKTVSYVTSAMNLAQGGTTVYDAKMTHTLTGPAEFITVSTFGDGTCELTPTAVTCDIGPLDSPGTGREIWVTARATGPGPISHHVTIGSGTADPRSDNNTVIESNRAIALSSLVLSPSTVAGGKASAAQVTLTDQAPAGDAVVRMTSSRPDIARVPATFVVPSWTNTRALNIIPAVVSSPTTVEISASYGLVTVTKTLTVLPPTLTQLYLTPTTVIGGCGTSAGRILLSGSAPAGGAVVPLTNTNSKAAVPASVTVPAGATSVTFSVPTSAVTTVASGTVTASYGGRSQALTLSVRPIRAQTIALSPNPAREGTVVSGTITLECPAAPGPVVVSLTSSNPAVAAPVTSSITIPAGARSAPFSVRTFDVSSSTPVSIYAWVFGVRKSATLTVTE
jgi:probable HAF family extracellular repeat protein